MPAVWYVLAESGDTQRAHRCLQAVEHILTRSGCEHNSEQVAAEVLGYTQVSWENLSGNEPQPSSHKKSWSELRHSERVAAVVLGYTGKAWDNESGSETQPASADKQWSELSPCADEGKHADCVCTCLGYMSCACFWGVR